MFYTGIGSRETPKDTLKTMTQLAKDLDLIGYTLRSGGADGADDYFERGATRKEIYLPWKMFNNNPSPLFKISQEAMALASEHHPAWDKLKDAVKKLMARNSTQVLGLELDTPSDFVVCWTPDGCESHLTRTAATGGTGLAITVASKRGIPIYNLQNQDSIDSLLFLIERLKT